MNLSNTIRANLKQNSSLYLTVGATIGVLATAFFTARATFQAAEVIREDEEANPLYTKSINSKERLMERTKLVWKYYIPPAICAGVTITCCVAANRISTKQLVVSTTMLGVADKAFAEYRDKVTEIHGKNKEQAIRDSIAEDHVKELGPTAEMKLVGTGKTLCLELYTDRPFYSEVETIRRAVNTVNAKVNMHDYATLSDFYWEIGLRPTSHSGNVGWRDGKLMQIEEGTFLTEDGQVCFTFDYVNLVPL